MDHEHAAGAEPRLDTRRQELELPGDNRDVLVIGVRGQQDRRVGHRSPAMVIQHRLRASRETDRAPLSVRPIFPFAENRKLGQGPLPDERA